MVYHANGGFNWHDLYYMPIKLREFYWRELLKVKEDESDAMNKATNKTSSNNLSKTRRR
jgi:hypothetical protein